jgi:hypothetical protein
MPGRFASIKAFMDVRELLSEMEAFFATARPVLAE